MGYSILWCSLSKFIRSFGASCHHQLKHASCEDLLFSFLVSSPTLKMNAIYFSEKSVDFRQATRPCITPLWVPQILRSIFWLNFYREIIRLHHLSKRGPMSRSWEENLKLTSVFILVWFRYATQKFQEKVHLFFLANINKISTKPLFEILEVMKVERDFNLRYTIKSVITFPNLPSTTYINTTNTNWQEETLRMYWQVYLKSFLIGVALALYK